MVVYFIINESCTMIKIGYSSGDPRDRLAAMQTGHYEKLTLLKAMKGDEQDEKLTHEMFKYLRGKGEWFRAAPELLDYIEKVYPVTGYPKIVKDMPIETPRAWNECSDDEHIVIEVINKHRFGSIPGHGTPPTVAYCQFMLDNYGWDEKRSRRTLIDLIKSKIAWRGGGIYGMNLTTEGKELLKMVETARYASVSRFDGSYAVNLDMPDD